MNTTEIRQWFTPDRLRVLDPKKMEDLAGIDHGVITNCIKGGQLSIDSQKSLSTLLKMIEKGFTDCNKSHE